MSVSKKIMAAAIVVAGFGVTSGAAAADDLKAERPTSAVTDLKVEQETSKATTCEGDILCGGLGRVCDAIGGTFNSHQSNDKGHDHAHGICTWPWE